MEILNFKIHEIYCEYANSTITYHLFGLRIVWILVRVIFERQSPVSLFDFLVRRCLGDLEQLVQGVPRPPKTCIVRSVKSISKNLE